MNTNPEAYFCISEDDVPRKIYFTLDEAMADPRALYIDTFDANGDNVRNFMYDVETKSYTESF